MKHLFLVLLAVFVLSGCSTTSTQTLGSSTISVTQASRWEKRQLKLAGLTAWKLRGRASVIYSDQNWPFELEWQQSSPNHYRMHIKHPVTKNELATIVKTARLVSLTNNGKVYRSSNADQLVEKNLGVKIPVRGMRHWVLGIPSPDYSVGSVQLDVSGRPLKLQQAGWTIRYLQYQNNKRDALPAFIKITRSSPRQVEVTTRIRQWNK